MKYSKLSRQFAGFALAAISFTACKKNDIIPPDEVAPLDSASITALRIRHTTTGTGAANTYYISAAGNDATGTGTISSPWKTLFKATSAVTASGSIIHVNAGTYTETQQCSLPVGVSIEGDGATSIVRSTVNSFQAPLLRLSSAAGTSGNQHISNLKFDGQSLATSWGIYIEGRSNVSIYNCTVTNFGDRGVIFAAVSLVL